VTLCTTEPHWARAPARRLDTRPVLRLLRDLCRACLPDLAHAILRHLPEEFGGVRVHFNAGNAELGREACDGHTCDGEHLVAWLCLHLGPVFCER
jgi:hypothetical protein